MSANKNLSKLALKVNTSGEVTDAGLESTYVSNAFFQDSTNPNLVSNGYFESVYTAADVLTKIKTVDGAGSGLDADTLDGANSTFFTNASNINAGTLGTGRLSGTYSISISGSADRLDGLQGTDFTSNNYVQGRFTSNNHITTRIGARATNTYVKSTFSSNNYLQTQLGTKLNSSSYTASDVLTKIKTVDGAGSGLDADLLDGISSAGFLRADAADTKSSGDLTFPDGVQANFGNTSDLQIYHDGTNSYVSEQGTGALKVLTNFLSIRDAADTETLLNATNNADVKLFYNGSKKLETTSVGVDVTGNIIVSGTVDGRDVAADGTTLDSISSTYTSNNYVKAIFSSNNYVKSTFTSNSYFQDNVMPVGAGSDKVFYENDQTVTTNYTITTGKNAMSAGPITLDPGVTVTIPSGSEWSIT